ncbi:MAG: hypothetical protein II711_01665, partial [Clostridia bacterium]|nr:hypothetical protein [Clostridia bacterium]
HTIARQGSTCIVPAADDCRVVAAPFHTLGKKAAIALLVQRHGKAPRSALHRYAAERSALPAATAQQHYGTKSHTKHQPPTAPMRAIAGRMSKKGIKG